MTPRERAIQLSSEGLTYAKIADRFQRDGVAWNEQPRAWSRRDIELLVSDGELDGVADRPVDAAATAPAVIVDPPVEDTEMRPCPFCGEPIRAVATKCRYCHEFVSGDRGGVRLAGGSLLIAITAGAAAVVASMFLPVFDAGIISIRLFGSLIGWGVLIPALIALIAAILAMRMPQHRNALSIAAALGLAVCSIPALVILGWMLGGMESGSGSALPYVGLGLPLLVAGVVLPWLWGPIRSYRRPLIAGPAVAILLASIVGGVVLARSDMAPFTEDDFGGIGAELASAFEEDAMDEPTNAAFDECWADEDTYREQCVELLTYDECMEHDDTTGDDCDLLRE